MNKNDQEFLVQRIRTRYTEKEYTQLDLLKDLDKKAARPAHLFGWIFGSIGAVVMGSGMSLVMTDLAASLGLQEPVLIGIPLGLLGMLMAILNYPFYKGILNKRRKKYADQIIAVSEELIKE